MLRARQKKPIKGARYYSVRMPNGIVIVNMIKK